MAASGAAAVGSGRRGELSMARVRERVLAKGFTEDQFEMAVDEYSVLDVSILFSFSRRCWSGTNANYDHAGLANCRRRHTIDLH